MNCKESGGGVMNNNFLRSENIISNIITTIKKMKDIKQEH